MINDAGFPPSTEPNLMRRISIPATITALGRGVRRAACRHLPKCDLIAKAAFDKFGWDDRDYELFRFELRYPPLASSVAMSMQLRNGFAAPAPVN